MATQGMVSIVKDGRVQMKIVAGCDGDRANELADWLRSEPTAKPQEVYDMALEIGFGNRETLVVQYGPDKAVVDPDLGELSALYKQKYGDASFNPRWEFGTADYTVVVDGAAPALKMKRRSP